MRYALNNQSSEEGTLCVDKLTALMALLTLAVTGAIAPTAAADELSATYGATLESDGTFSEFCRRQKC